MNRMLIGIFDNDSSAADGLTAMRKLHADGSITLYSVSVVARGADGKIDVRLLSGQESMGAGVGLAIGGLIGLLGGPAGVAVGAVTGSLVGAVRDYWVAGVGLDFVEEVNRNLQPGKVALIAEVEEEWVMPIDHCMTQAGGIVLRCNRLEIAEAQLHRELANFKTEIGELEAEYHHATDSAKATLLAKAEATSAKLEAAKIGAAQRVDELKLQTTAKLGALSAQLDKIQGAGREKLERRMESVRGTYDKRCTKLKRAWGLIKESMSA